MCLHQLGNTQHTHVNTGDCAVHICKIHAWKLFGNDAALVFLDILVHREENLEVAWEMPKQTQSQISLADKAIASRNLFAAWIVTGQKQKGL